MNQEAIAEARAAIQANAIEALRGTLAAHSGHDHGGYCTGWHETPARWPCHMTAWAEEQLQRMGEK